MEQARFDGLARQLARLGSRRTALSAAAITGITAAGLGGAAVEAKKNVSAEKKKKRRGKRGKRGHQGPPAGANAVVMTTTCTLDATGGVPGDTRGCTASCDEGMAAVGGGFDVEDVLGSLGVVRSSAPETDGNKPIGWTAEIEFINIGQDFDITVYAICVPA